jgi:hypothetical protein
MPEYQVRIDLIASKTVTADSEEEAIAKARKTSLDEPRNG